MEPINFQMTTNEISIKTNNIDDGEFRVLPEFTRTTWSDEKYGYVRLITELKNTEENPFPLDIKVDVTARIEIDQIPADQLEDFLKIQAIQLLLPYVRTMITSVTTSALMPPIILPLMDPRQIFKE